MGNAFDTGQPIVDVLLMLISDDEARVAGLKLQSRHRSETEPTLERRVGRGEILLHSFAWRVSTFYLGPWVVPRQNTLSWLRPLSS